MSELRSRRFVYDRIERTRPRFGPSATPRSSSPAAPSPSTGGLVFKTVCTEVYAKRSGEWRLVSLHVCTDGY